MDNQARVKQWKRENSWTVNYRAHSVIDPICGNCANFKYPDCSLASKELVIKKLETNMLGWCIRHLRKMTK